MARRRRAENYEILQRALSFAFMLLSVTKQRRPLQPAPPSVPEARNVEVPQKVFVERVPEYEYSETEPAHLNRLYRLLDGYYGAANFIELFFCLPEVYAPVHEIASRVADAQWEFCKTWNDEVDYKDETFNKLFTKPNPFMSMWQLTYVSVCYYLLTGKMFWSKNRPDTLDDNYKNILSWFPLPAHQVWVEQRKVDPYTCTEAADYVNWYEVRDLNTGKKRRFEPQEVMHLITGNFRHPYDLNKSVSPLMGAEKAIKNLIPVYEARGLIYIKRGALGFLVSRKTDDSGSVALTESETKALHEDYQRSYGVTSAGKSNIGITGQPIDFIQVGMSIKDLQPFEETLSDAVAIYSTLRVPRHLVPSKDQGTFSNVESSMRAFYSDVISPLANLFAEVWDEGFGFEQFRKYVNPSYEHIDILQEDKKTKAEVDKTLTETAVLQYEKGIITKNERNGMVGVQAVEGGDTYATDEDNADPIAVKIGVGGMQALQAILTDGAMSEEAKTQSLVILFGIKEEDAKKLTTPKENEQTDTTGKPPTEAEGGSAANNLPNN